MLTENERGFKRLMLFIGATMLIFYVLFQVLVSVWMVVDAVLLELLDPVTAEVISQLIYAIVYLSSFMVPAFILRAMLKKNYRPMPLEPKLPRDSVAYIIAGIACILSIAYLNAMILDAFGYSQFQSDMMGESSSMANYQIVLSFITTAIVPGICEEFLFRGAIMTNLKPYGKAPAIIISAVLFGFMHQNAGQLLYATAAGLVLGWVAYETGSIWCGMLMHFLNNFISVAEGALAERLEASVANIVLPMFECLLFAAGVACAVYIIIKHEKEKRTRVGLSEGFFGRSFGEIRDEGDATVKLPAGQLTRAFFSPTIIVFLVLAGASMVLLLAMSLLTKIFPDIFKDVLSFI